MNNLTFYRMRMVNRVAFENFDAIRNSSSRGVLHGYTIGNFNRAWPPLALEKKLRGAQVKMGHFRVEDVVRWKSLLLTELRWNGERVYMFLDGDPEWTRFLVRCERFAEEVFFCMERWDSPIVLKLPSGLTTDYAVFRMSI